LRTSATRRFPPPDLGVKRIAFGLGPVGMRQLYLLEFLCVMLIGYATLEAGSMVGASALLQPPISSLVVPYLLFLVPCAVLAPFIFAYRASAERPKGAGARIFAAGFGIFAAAASPSGSAPLRLQETPPSPDLSARTKPIETEVQSYASLDQ
jgi:hypothetical protein